MTDRWQAQYNFYSSFGVPAYEENAVIDRDDISYPYITYEAVTAGFNGDATPSVSIWSRSDSWAEADELADMIEDELGYGGTSVPYTGGVIWFTARAPFAQSMGDPNDDKIKRKLIGIDLHFM